MKNLGDLLIQSLEDAVAFEEGKLDARIQIRELTVSEKKAGIVQSNDKRFARVSAAMIDKSACGE